jgi:sialic acid synthase SpsE
MKVMRIGGRRIGNGAPCFVIAEIGTNHNRDLAAAKALVDAAGEAGVDAVKFQFYHGEDVVTPLATCREYGLGGLYPPDKRMVDVYNERFRTPREWFPELSEYVEKKGMIALSTPHCLDCAEFMMALRMPAFKVASVEVTNLPFLKALARFRKPIILSTGFATPQEIREAVQTVRHAGNRQLALLHCVSDYPTRPEDVNLRFMETLRRRYDVPVGFSDHTLGTAVSLGAVALGANIIERHITLDCRQPGPDHSFALEPETLLSLVRDIRDVEKAKGRDSKVLTRTEQQKRKLYLRSITAAHAVRKGQIITLKDLDLKRPGTGLPASRLKDVVDKRARINIEQYAVIQPGHLA